MNRESLDSFHYSPRATNFGPVNRRTKIEYYADKFSTLIPKKPLGLIVHGLCFLGVNVFAIECIGKSCSKTKPGQNIDGEFSQASFLSNCPTYFTFSFVRLKKFFFFFTLFCSISEPN